MTGKEKRNNFINLFFLFLCVFYAALSLKSHHWISLLVTFVLSCAYIWLTVSDWPDPEHEETEPTG